MEDLRLISLLAGGQSKDVKRNGALWMPVVVLEDPIARTAPTRRLPWPAPSPPPFISRTLGVTGDYDDPGGMSTVQVTPGAR